MRRSSVGAGASGRRRALQRVLLGAPAAWLGSGASRSAPASALALAVASASSARPALKRGLNLTHWFEYEQGQAVSAGEMRGLQRLGLDHVRIPVDPVVLGWTPDPAATAEVRPPWYPALRGAVETALDAGLDAVVDLHLTQSTKLLIEQQPPREAALVALWSGLSRLFADLPADRLAFELLNEPQYYGWNASRWSPLQRRLLAAVRANAPSHLVLLSGNEGGSFKGLSQLPLVRDARVAYVFHCYEPFLFTHQGADWLDTRYTTAGLRGNLRYPAQHQAGSVPRLSQPHPRAAKELADYIDADWGPARVRAELEPVGAWARRHGVQVVCNEFGVIRARVDPASRYRCIADVRQALEAQQIGWTLWDYTDIFGITAESATAGRVGQRSLEAQAVSALGLRVGG